jgi:hypothetical protein
LYVELLAIFYFTSSMFQLSSTVFELSQHPIKPEAMVDAPEVVSTSFPPKTKSPNRQETQQSTISSPPPSYSQEMSMDSEKILVLDEPTSTNNGINGAPTPPDTSQHKMVISPQPETGSRAIQPDKPATATATALDGPASYRIAGSQWINGFWDCCSPVNLGEYRMR